MKANELMIGDLINGFGVVRRVTGIHGLERPEDDGLLTTMVPGCEFPESNLSFRPCYARPIPLTKEILEKNGFEVQDQGGGRSDVWIGFGIDCEGDIEVEFQHNIPTHLKIDGVFKGEYYISTNIKYVHELQHALRLCGVEKEVEQ